MRVKLRECFLGLCCSAVSQLSVRLYRTGTTIQCSNHKVHVIPVTNTSGVASHTISGFDHSAKPDIQKTLRSQTKGVVANLKLIEAYTVRGPADGGAI